MKSIKADPCSIESLFRNQFVIPDFQRPYSWSELQCAQLVSDLTSAFHDSLIDSSQEKYFLGNIIYYLADESSEEIWTIVDGQQRLTTLLMLMCALHETTRGSDEYTTLKHLIYKVDKQNIAIEGDVRLTSDVPPGERGYNPGDLKRVLALELEQMKEENKKNPFLLNYNRLSKDLDDWWRNNKDKWEGFINFLLKKVVLLPIKCESEWDALDLFEIINDRGVPLDDADVFKARFYKAVQADEKQEFVQRWNELSKHLDLFRIYMHISKAQNAPKGDYLTKRDKLRKYINDECLKNPKKPLAENWRPIVDSIERCHFYKTYKGKWCDDEVFSAKERIYWKILGEYPNKSWQYPLFVFINKHGLFTEDGLTLSKRKREDYLDLLEATVKFFFMRGIVHNSIDAVRDTAHEVCVKIEQDDLYVDAYKKHKNKQKDLDEAQRKMDAFNYGRSYRRGLAFLGSFLNKRQQATQESIVLYADKICGDIHLEHILPQNWRDKAPHDGWDKKAHGENYEKAGNLMPLERGTNTRSSDSFFRSKQRYYEESELEDAIDLRNAPPRWILEDLNKRHKEVVKRLMDFFKS